MAASEAAGTEVANFTDSTSSWELVDDATAVRAALMPSFSLGCYGSSIEALEGKLETFRSITGYFFFFFCG